MVTRKLILGSAASLLLSGAMLASAPVLAQSSDPNQAYADAQARYNSELQIYNQKQQDYERQRSEYSANIDDYQRSLNAPLPRRLPDAVATNVPDSNVVVVDPDPDVVVVDRDPGQTVIVRDPSPNVIVADDFRDRLLIRDVPPLMRVAPEVAEAFRVGGGVGFEEFGPGCVEALDLINRGQYESRLADYWLKSLPDVAAKLAAGGRALDVGCGSGSVCGALAKAFPATEIVGIDPDPESIQRAQQSFPAVKFLQETTSGMKRDNGFDLITLCDVLHDLAAPMQTLKEIRALLAPDGVLFIVEPKAADRLEDNRDAVSTTFYGFSLFHCMTQSLARGGPGLGTCLGPAATGKLLHEAGFSRFDRLDIKSLTNLFYAARP
jgi:2-polyprenyl-3-methyl-5-hydroxy-6-metoxy-1,4-benzoquinol methylase